MPAPTMQEILVDLRSPNISVEEAEDMIVELIDWRRADGIERWKVGKELDTLANEIPERFVPALESAKSRTMFSGSTLSPVAFSISSTRQQVVQHLVKHGLANPALAREVLLEYVGRKERIVRGWPGGVRAGIEVIQGGLRDIGVELGTSPVGHLVEQVQLETGHISLSQLVRFLKSFPPPATAVAVGIHEAKALPQADRAVSRWLQTCLLGGASRFEAGVELEEIKRQVGPHLYPIFPVVLRTSLLPVFPCHPHAHGLASADRLVVPAITSDPDPGFVTEVLMEYVAWERRRTVGGWGRRERAEMGSRLAAIERQLAQTVATVHLVSTVQHVRWQTRCPPFSPTSVEGRAATTFGDDSTSELVLLEATLQIVPRTVDDGQVASMLQAYIDGERAKAADSLLDVGGWGEVDKKRVSLALHALRERLNDPSLDLIFGAIMLQLLPVVGRQPPAGALTPDPTTPTSENSHISARKLVSLSITTTPTSINGKANIRSSPPSPLPTIPLPPVPSRRQTTEIAPLAPSRPSLERRQQSEQNTASTAPPSILKKVQPHPASVIISHAVESIAAVEPTHAAASNVKTSQPERPAKSTRRFSLFGGGKSKSEAVDDKKKDKGRAEDGKKDKAAEREKEKPISPPKKSKHAPPAVPRITSTPKSKMLTAEDIQLKRNTEANKTSPVVSPSVSPTMSISHPLPLTSRSVSSIVRDATEPAPAPAPIIKSISSLSFADSIASTNTTSTSGSSTSTASKNENGTKLEKKRNLLLKKQSSTSSNIPASASMVDLPAAKSPVEVSEAESYLAFDIHPTLPAALSSTGDLHGRLEKAQTAISAAEDVGVATPRPRKMPGGDGRRKSMVVEPSADGDKKSRRFSLFGSKKSKEDRFPPLPPSPGILDETFDRRRLSMSRSSSQTSLFDSERPTSKVFLNDRDFPDFAQLRAPHQMKSPPKNLAPLPVAASPHTSPRQQAWRSPAASFSRGNRGMSTPPIMEGDGEQSLSESPAHAAKVRSMLANVVESDPGHGGLEMDEAPPMPRTALTRVYSLADNATSRDFDLTRKIDPPAPTPPPPAPSELPSLVTPPLSSARQTSTVVGSTPPSVVGPISPAMTPEKTSGEKTRPDSTMSFGAESGPALSMLFSNSSAEASPVQSAFSTSPPAPKRSLHPPPPSPTTSAGPSSSSHHDHEEHRPPILTVRAVFAALSPTEHHSTGKVLDILMGFIDRERERSIMLDRKKGWGDAERTKVGWIISEVETELLPTNPHLTPIIERVRILTDCPPQSKPNKRSSKRVSSSEARPILSSTNSSSSLASSSSMASTSTSASTSSDASTVSASSVATDSSLETDATGESDLSRSSMDSDDTVTFHASPTSIGNDADGLERNSSTRTITRTHAGGQNDRDPSSGPAASQPRPSLPFIPVSSLDSLPRRAINARSGSGSAPFAIASPPTSPSHGGPVRSNTVSAPRHAQHNSTSSEGRRTSSETAPPPYERARRTSSLRDT